MLSFNQTYINSNIYNYEFIVVVIDIDIIFYKLR
jgi:hypothetical protein